jgi:hypothetical protein
MLRLVRKFYPLALPLAFSYFACRSLAPKMMRLEFKRIGAVLAAFRDFFGGVSGRPSRHTDLVLRSSYLNARDARRSARKTLLKVLTGTSAILILAAIVLAGAVMATTGGHRTDNRPAAGVANNQSARLRPQGQ